MVRSSFWEVCLESIQQWDLNDYEEYFPQHMNQIYQSECFPLVDGMTCYAWGGAEKECGSP
jgi:hypothetical protein